ncbi:MAG: ribonuclease E/G [Pseudomonadota bacterium]
MTPPRRPKPVKTTVLVEELNGSLLVATMQNRRLNGLEVDPDVQEVRWGSLYWGRVERIDKTLDAAFISLDGENIGFLPARDVRLPHGSRMVNGGEVPIGKLLQPGQFILVQAKDDFIAPPSKDMAHTLPLERKHPRVTMAVTLPGRYLIYAPYETENQVSRRIRDKATRKLLVDMLDTLVGCHGCIMRAAAADTQTDILLRESRILARMWEQIQDHATGNAAQLIMLGPDAIHRSLSDLAGGSIERIEVNAPDQYDQVCEWCDLYGPDLLIKVIEPQEDYDDTALALFSHYDLMQQIEMLFRPYVILPSGGSCIIEDTAAATVIDVNRGADKNSALTVNMEAAEDIARQLRIRNLGGIILIDFLKLKTGEEKKAFIQSLDKMVQSDPCTVQIHGMTKLGLLEMTRNRRTLPLVEKLDAILHGD